MQLHVRSGVRLCECSAEGCFGEDRKLQRVIYLSSPNPNRSLHHSTPLSASLSGHQNFRLWPINGGLPVLPGEAILSKNSLGGISEKILGL